MKTKQFELSGRCNLRCEFCYNKEYLEKWRNLEIDYVLEKAGNGNLIFLGGGEPTLYKDIEKLIEKLLEKGNIVVISTNGTIYKKFPKSNNLQIQISLPALDKKIYSEITKKDAIEKVKENIEKYSKDYKTFVNMPVYEKNFSEIEKVAEFCKQLGIPLVISDIILVNGIKRADKEKLKQKCLELKLKGYEIYFPNKSWEGIEYYVPEVN
jgi:MoaA/NifB/PqqE/SkfB family radical SAM enzyme